MNKENIWRRIWVAILSISLILGLIPVNVFAEGERPTDVEEPGTGNVIIKVEMEALSADKTALLAQINDIRREACDLELEITTVSGYKKKLSPAMYKDIKWSSQMEEIALTRAAEANLKMSHYRPKGDDVNFNTINFKGYKQRGEVLAWGRDIKESVEAWEYEKENITNPGSAFGGELGHYYALVDPDFKYIGLAAVHVGESTYQKCAAGSLSKGGIDSFTPGPMNEDQVIKPGAFSQLLEVNASSLTDVKVKGQNTMTKGNIQTLSLIAGKVSYTTDLGPSQYISNFNNNGKYVEIIKNIQWDSKEKSIVTVDGNGNVTAQGPGKTQVTATVAGREYTFDVTVEGQTVTTYKATYEFESATPGTPLPSAVTALKPADRTDIADGTPVTPTTPNKTEVAMADGKWLFKGYTPATATVNGADITFKGSWEFLKNATYKATYEFESATPGTPLPSEVTALKPADRTDIADGTPVTPTTPNKTEVAMADGKWLFKGYTPATATVNGADITFKGSWEFQKNTPNPPVTTYKAIHEFESATPGTPLPSAVTALKPADRTDIADGTPVTPTTPNKTEVAMADGKWLFKGYTPATATVNGADITFKGSWEFLKNTPTSYEKKVVLASYIKNSMSEIIQKSEGRFENFLGLKIDGKLIDPISYTAVGENTNTLITYKPTFLETLSVGTHEVEILFSDGNAKGQLVMLASAAESTSGASSSVPTGDNENMPLYITILCMATVEIFVLMKKKRNYTKK